MSFKLKFILLILIIPLLLLLIAADQITGATDIAPNTNTTTTDSITEIIDNKNTGSTIGEYSFDSKTNASININNNYNDSNIEITEKNDNTTQNTTNQKEKFDIPKDKYFDTITSASNKIAYQLNNQETSNKDKIVMNNKQTTTTTTTTTTVKKIKTQITTTTTIKKTKFTHSTTTTTIKTTQFVYSTTTTTIKTIKFTYSTTTTTIKQNNLNIDSTITFNNEVVEITNETTDDYFYVDNTEKKSTMIIFPENNKDYPPSLKRNYEDESENLMFIKTTPLDFVPKTEKEFMTATFEFRYNKDNTIVSGENTIESKLGESLFTKAYKLYRNSNITGAKSIFKKLIFYNYRKGDDYYYLGWCYYTEKNYKLSIAYIKKSLSSIANSDSLKIAKRYSQIANIYFTINAFNNAIKYYDKALSYDNDFTQAYNGLGLSYYKIGDYKNALVYWEKGQEKGDMDCKKNYLWLKEHTNYQTSSFILKFSK